MKIISGLFDHIVLQRNKRNLSEAAIHGTTKTTGELFVRIHRAGTRWKKVGRVINGSFRFSLTAIPTGGPYKVELQIRNHDHPVDTLTVKDVMIGDVWICAGQSNMQGIGSLEWAEKPHPKVRAFYLDDRWAMAKDPIHNMSECVDQVHLDLYGGTHPRQKSNAMGPGVSFGKEMHRRTGIPQGLISCAHGATSMAQWSPALKQKGTRSLYGATIRRLVKNGGRVAGVIWYQGESEARVNTVSAYTRKMIRLVKALRRDTGNPNLPIVAVQLGRVIDSGVVFNPECWNAIQEQQRLLPRKISHLAIVPAIDLQLDDIIHISGKDQRRVGQRLAEAMEALLINQKSLSSPISIRSTKLHTNKKTGFTEILVRLDNAKGNLHSTGRPSGFTILRNGSDACIFDIWLKGNHVLIQSTLLQTELKGLPLYYGYGTNPYCNIYDEGKRPLAVCGPVRIS